MKNRKCLYCYLPLGEDEIDFHPHCSRRIFGAPSPPVLPFSEAQLEELGRKIIRRHEVITGVQPKLSLRLTRDKTSNRKRFTIVGALGNYILKPHTDIFSGLPEVEDLTMHLAEIAGIVTVPHSLIRMQSGKLAYVTKRIDRTEGRKIHMEDMCQLTGRLTEDKYRGSYEQIAKVIQQYSDAPGLDAVNFFEQVLFCFLTGNADMHLKNFSLINTPGRGAALAPAYDMVSTKLVMPSDLEDLALTLNGRKKKITKRDFDMAFSNTGLDEKQIDNIYKKMKRSVPQWLKFIDTSFLSKKERDAYKGIIRDQAKRLQF
ncbi:HipA domain-containing protein [Chitinophaga alhagiae]|uniref:HipA domain-containing protein n=1 Tax=Chitinophaga alhagiae TaxID=2203219 RepID=UPI000E5B8C19|nr:HipA domain-containing protein [Chitinophaga alhagiae]